MQYLESEILRCLAQTAIEEKQPEKAEQYKMKAAQIIDEMLKDEPSLKPYLLERVKKSHYELTNNL